MSTHSASMAGADFVVEISDQALGASAPATGDGAKVVDVSLGDVTIKQPGTVDVKLRAEDRANWKPIDVRAMMLTPR